MTLLCTIEEAAELVGVPEASLRSAAETHGFLVRMGRAVRVERETLPKLVKKCLDQPKEQDSTSSSTARTGSSVTPGNQTAQRATQAAERLKKSSRHTSPPKGGKVLPMSRKT